MTIWEVRTGHPNPRQAKAGHTCNASSLYTTEEAAMAHVKLYRLRHPNETITVSIFAEWGNK